MSFSPSLYIFLLLFWPTRSSRERERRFVCVSVVARPPIFHLACPHKFGPVGKFRVDGDEMCIYYPERPFFRPATA